MMLFTYHGGTEITEITEITEKKETSILRVLRVSLVESILLFLSLACCIAPAADKKIVFIAGNPSHGAGEHEYRAGCLLLQKCLKTIPGISTVVHSNDWPKSTDAFEGADAIIIFSSGGGGHPAIKDNRLQLLGGLMKKGVGLGGIHYAVELPTDKGGPEFLQWIGGKRKSQTIGTKQEFPTKATAWRAAEKLRISPALREATFAWVWPP